MFVLVQVSDESWNIKSLKQKQAVSKQMTLTFTFMSSQWPIVVQINGVCYLFQEIYGIENKKNGEEGKITSTFYRQHLLNISTSRWRCGDPGWWRRGERGVRGLSVGCPRHPHSSMQASVLVQLMRCGLSPELDMLFVASILERTNMRRLCTNRALMWCNMV